MASSALWYFDFLWKQKEERSRAITRSEHIGVPKLGGPFQLVDRQGAVRTNKDYKGKYMLIYFGFCHCPDICPQEMEKQTQAIEMLDKDFGGLAPVVPIFISVDPHRDTPAKVDAYCKDFHPRLVGLTGTPEEVKKVSRAYRVYYNESVRTSDTEYLIDHSIIHYLMGRNGKFIDFFGKNMTAQEIVTKMKQHIADQDEQARLRKQQRQGVDEDE